VGIPQEEEDEVKQRRKKKLPYKEGDWFAVPLRKGGCGVGVVARCDGKGTVLGYFFGPKRRRLPELGDLSDLEPGRADLIEMFGDLGLLKGEWKVLGSLPNWDRAKWLVPRFARTESILGLTELIEYSEDTLQEVRSIRCSPEKARQYPEDGLAGYGAVEIRLTKLLDR
jgi:hypothetical protein